ncbi:hypothetical protein DPMN_136004 [Dreissena polymorpha]|uniref:Uncharacterized protein n=1 Tax=Dreissena polymorpha TaxID=45954 RepID=A0A9D4G036_DREPO|nr:hypothetical protein DPMN_136004 [Dreissena polymorpha]
MDRACVEDSRFCCDVNQPCLRIRRTLLGLFRFQRSLQNIAREIPVLSGTLRSVGLRMLQRASN